MNIDGIILAAGASTRFGQTKQLLTWIGNDGVARPLVTHITEIALQSSLRRVYLVIGHDRERIQTAIGPITNNQRLHIVKNEDFIHGQSTSVHAGLAALMSDADAAMFLLCDQPKISPALIDKLIAQYESDNPLICLPMAGDRRGNPVIFSKQLFPELLRIEGDTGGRPLINKYWDQASKLAQESADVFMDIDTAEDLLHR